VVNANATSTFTKPGSYFLTVRVVSQPNLDTTIPYGLIQNLAQVRVLHVPGDPGRSEHRPA
jgi:hypothetical protein